MIFIHDMIVKHKVSCKSNSKSKPQMFSGKPKKIKQKESRINKSKKKRKLIMNERCQQFQLINLEITTVH